MKTSLSRTVWNREDAPVGGCNSNAIRNAAIRSGQLARSGRRAHRQVHPEMRAGEFAFDDFNCTSMCVYELLHDGQADPGAAHEPALRRRALVERVEDAVLFGRWDPGP